MATGIWEPGTGVQHWPACSVYGWAWHILTCGQCQCHRRDVLCMGAVQVQGIGVRQQHAPGHVTTSREEGHVQQCTLIWVPQNVAQHGAALQMVEGLQSRTVDSAKLSVWPSTGVVQIRQSLHLSAGECSLHDRCGTPLQVDRGPCPAGQGTVLFRAAYVRCTSQPVVSLQVMSGRAC